MSLGLTLVAQPILDLSTAQALARSESPAARQAALEALSAQQDYAAFTASLKPQVRLSADLPGFSRSINGILQDDGSTIFRSQNQTYGRASLSLSQALPFTGGQVSLFSSLVNFNRFGPNGFTSWQSVPVGFSYTQPLFQPNRYRWDQRQQNAALALAEVQALRQREEAVLSVTRSYLRAWLAQAQQQQARQRLAQNDSIYQIAQARHRLGKVSEEQLLQSELALLQARSALQEQQLAYQQAFTQLLTLLDLPSDGDWQLGTPPPLPPLRSSPEAAATLALQHADLQAAQRLERLRAERELAETRQTSRFQADLTASFGLNQSGSSLGEAYQQLEDQQAFSLSLNLPLLQWGQGRAQLEAAQARRESLHIGQEQARRAYADEIRYRVQQYALLQDQLGLAQQTVDVAQRRYRFSRARFELGKLPLTELLIAQNEQLQAQQVYWQLLQQLHLAQAELRTETLYDFIQQKSVIIEQ